MAPTVPAPADQAKPVTSPLALLALECWRVRPEDVDAYLIELARERAKGKSE